MRNRWQKMYIDIIYDQYFAIFIGFKKFIFINLHLVCAEKTTNTSKLYL